MVLPNTSNDAAAVVVVGTDVEVVENGSWNVDVVDPFPDGADWNVSKSSSKGL